MNLRKDLLQKHNNLQDGWRYAKGFEGLICIGPNLQIKFIKPPSCELPLRVRVEEIWKPVSGYEGIYEVSNMGRVRRIMPFYRGVKLWKGRKNRPRLDLSKEGVKEHWYIYDLVLTSFVGPKPDNPRHFACHINDDPWDNRLVNLMWGTQSQNEKHKQQNKKRKSIEEIYNWDKSYQLTDEQIYEIWESEDDQITMSWKYGVPSSTIWLIKHNVAMLPVPADKPESIARKEERLLKEIPF